MLRFAGRFLLCAAAPASTTPPDVQLAARAVTEKLADLSPKKIAEVLDNYIIGQADGKRAVAISLRNRWRRRQLSDSDLRKEVVPKNILLVGPTGVGKTEISRRMARITDAPFVKVEATKYTEVGFKGKDVESIIEELYMNAKSKAKRLLEQERQEEALAMALDTVFSSWMVKHRLRGVESLTRATSTEEDTAAGEGEESRLPDAAAAAAEKPRKSRKEAEEASTKAKEVTLEYFREHYHDIFKDDLVTIDVAAPQSQQRSAAPGGIDLQSVGMLLGLGGEPRKAKVMVTKKVAEAVPLAKQEALDKLIDENSVNALARALAEEEGVVFVDEIDKVVAEPSSANADVSSTGVQQDLLPLIEGSNVTMKDGSVIATDNILFICSGAFHTAKTSDMIAELQGRLPVRVELKALTENDFRRILTEPKYNLLKQQEVMMKTEGINLTFTDDAVRELARVTCAVNSQAQNIGARRLNTVLERVMDKYSFDCDKYAGTSVQIDAAIVRDATEKLQKNINLAKYLL